MQKDVYFGFLKLYGKESADTLLTSNNYADTLLNLGRFAEAKALIRKMMPVARRILGESDEITLRMRWNYGAALYADPTATLYDLRKAVTMLEDTDQIARRVFGGAHPDTVGIEQHLRDARAALRARETPSPPGTA